jgi:hypothetical protein
MVLVILTFVFSATRFHPTWFTSAEANLCPRGIRQIFETQPRVHVVVALNP